jgi:hypothetical protein
MRIISLALLFALVIPAAAQADGWHHWHRWGHWNRWHHWSYVDDEPATYGAIAFSNSTARFGSSWGRLSPEAAQAAAVSACGVDDCTSRVVEQNQFAVLARGTGGTSTAWNDDLMTAQQAALAACSTKGTNCRVVATIRD